MTLGWAVPGAFAGLLVPWQRSHGRHGLPWQGTGDPYKVWLSEVMLQQTQVSTVLDYFPRFLTRFPDVVALANGHSDEVMSLWSGLGYYSRARNLHRCAQMLVEHHGGLFPTNAADLQTLPGIGASTAAAIAAFCHGERISILDGNVRRVLSRVSAFEGDVSQAGPQKQLWEVAQSLLPVQPEGDDMSAYTQGLMDLGATVCTRSKPACGRCPMQDICLGLASGEPSKFPVKSRKLKRHHESWWLAVVIGRDCSGERRVWLERRPNKGIWSGLFCTPVLSDEASARALMPEAVSVPVPLEPLAHSLTHRELRLHPLIFNDVPEAWAEGRHGEWVPWRDLPGCGLPAPLRPLLNRLG